MSRVAVAAVIVMLGAGAAFGQDRASQPTGQAAAQPAPAAPKSPAPTARLQVVLSRFNGDKRVASQPYMVVAVASGQQKVLRIGAEVPIAGVAAGTKDSPSYKAIGTNIVASVRLQEDGRYLVEVEVESSSPYPDDQKQGGRPAFRSYRLDGNAYLRDGQTAEIATATDSLTGEVIKLEVTLTAVK